MTENVLTVVLSPDLKDFHFQAEGPWVGADGSIDFPTGCKGTVQIVGPTAGKLLGIKLIKSQIQPTPSAFGSHGKLGGTSGPPASSGPFKVRRDDGSIYLEDSNKDAETWWYQLGVQGDGGKPVWKDPRITNNGGADEPPTLPRRPPPIAAQDEVTRLLDAWSAGDPEALEQAIPLVIDELRLLARSFMARQRPGHTLQPTALVNEAYARLVGSRPMSWESRRQFFAYVASTMRRILVNHARDRRAAKRGAEVTRVAFEDALDVPAGAKGAAVEVGLLDLDRALESLAAIDPRQGRIVELRYFGGLTVAETAGVLGVSERTVKREWHTARLWLLRALG